MKKCKIFCLSTFQKAQPYFIPRTARKLELWQGVALNLNQEKPAPKQLNLNKLSDAGGFQIRWLTTLAESNFLAVRGINMASVFKVR